MKKLIMAALGIVCSMNVFSQCPNTTGNYEFSIKNDAKTITILARNTTGTIRSSYVHPAINGYFTGLVFGVKWSEKSDVTLYPNTSEAPFNVQTSSSSKVQDGISFQSYGDVADNLPVLSKEWMSGQWNVIATIPYAGTLANGDKFELAECGFNSTTDPYFSNMDKDGSYGQFAPNLVRNDAAGANIAVANAVIVYPNPTMGDLHVDVSSAAVTRATFRVMDMTGKTIKTIQSDLVEGLNQITVNVAELSNGLYMLKVVDGKALNYSQSFNKQ
jgi:hypothetical protein